jgi:hypothetical protein
MTDTEFVEGLYVNAPRDKAPDYVKGSLAIEPAKLIAWLQSRGDEKVRIDIKVGRSGKWYCAVDAWKPNGEQSPRQESKPAHADASNGFVDDSIPFAPIPRRQLW